VRAAESAKGAKQAAEKGRAKGEFQYRLLQGLKPNVDMIGFIGTTEVVPCYKASRNRASSEFFIAHPASFSAACKAQRFFSAPCGTAEAVPFQSLTFTLG
jgi:hypothetical protein